MNIFHKEKKTKKIQELPIPPGTNGYGAIFVCPKCKKNTPKIGLHCENCGEKIFDK